jgi:hypothetical protein
MEVALLTVVLSAPVCAVFPWETQQECNITTSCGCQLYALDSLYPEPADGKRLYHLDVSN